MSIGRAWWGAGLVFASLGSAMLAGIGVAGADAEPSDAAGPTSRSAERDEARPANEQGVQATTSSGSSTPSVRTVEQIPDQTDVTTVPAQTAGSNDGSPEAVFSDVLVPHIQAERGSIAKPLTTADDSSVASSIDSELDAALAITDRPDASDGALEPVADLTVPTETADHDTADPPVPDIEAIAAPGSPVISASPTPSQTVTGVKVDTSFLDIPVGPHGYKTRADWYFPTQADGSVSAAGVTWLQHGFLGEKSFYSQLARTLSQETNSIVVAPNVSSFPLRCAGCWLNGAAMQEAVAGMFVGDRASLNSSASAAGFEGALPEHFVMSGHSAGGGFATSVGGFYATDPGSDGSLRGVVMFDGFAFSGVLPEALQKLQDPYIPVYQVAAPPQLFNFFGMTTKELVAARPDEFVGAVLAGGSHVDSMLGSNPIVDFFAQLVTGFSPPGNTEAVYTLATGWINDMYAGLGPIDGNGIYGEPDQFIVLGDASAVVLGPPPVVDLGDYLGTWYEVGSVKQFFSIGLVNTKAVYSLNPDDSIKVVNSGNYFFDNGPESKIVGAALPVDPANNKLNVSFFLPVKPHPPGNYWIIDLSADYGQDSDGWAIVSDPTGSTGFLLSRAPTVSDGLYHELLDRASAKGVRGRITPTRQYVSTSAVLAV